MLTNEERRLVNEVINRITALEERINLKAELVKMNFLLEQILAAQGGLTKEEVAAAIEQANLIRDKLKGISAPPNV